MTGLNMNQFAVLPVQGDEDMGGKGGLALSAMVSSNIGNGVTLVGGQPVKFDSALNGGIPQVLPLAADTDIADGYVLRNMKDINFGSGARLEMAMNGKIMWMTASGSVTRFAYVENVSATVKVKAWGGVNPIAGRALDNAADGDVFRVLITESQKDGAVRTARVSATLAEINAGKVLIPGTAGKKILVTGAIWKVTGAFATTTSVELESTNGAPVAVETVAVAGLTNGATIIPSESHVTLGAGFGAPLGVGDGLQVVNNGAAATGGTSIDFDITYTLTN